MAPDLVHENDAPPNLTGRALLAFGQLIVATGALVLAFFAAMKWLRAHHAGDLAMLGATVAYGVLLVGLIALWSRSKSVRMCITVSQAARRYRRRMLVAASVYVAALILAIFVNVRLQLATPLAYATALLPALPVIGMFAAMGLYLREETDEFLRAVQIESSLWATGAVMAVCAGWGFLEMFHLAPHVEAWVVVPIWSLVLGTANVFIRRRYR